MKNIGLWILTIALLGSATARADAISIALDFSTLSGSPGQLLSFTGTLTNTIGNTVWLVSDNYNLAPEIAAGFDDSPFFANAPLNLAGFAASGDIDLFNVTIPDPTATGDYTSNFMILGGADGNSQDILGSVDFTVDVTQPSDTAPEPGAFSLSAVAAGLLLAARRLRR
jgi:hypothetical protein